MSSRRRLWVALVATGLVATACTQAVSGQPQAGTGAPGVPSAGTAPAGPTSFRDCTTQLERAGLPIPSGLTGKVKVGCAQLRVPLDYAHPHGRTITLTVVRMHDTDNTDPAGSLLLNPGGPGASGLQFALGFLGQVPRAVFAKFDLIGFDPRGVGQSTPVHCVSDEEKDTLLAESPDVTTASGFTAAKQQVASFAKACEAAVGSALPFYNTVNTARDMDLIRRAVGDSRMNYLGFSYGTELGWVYAHLFPKKVRVMVLDGAVDPDTDGIAQFAEQLKGFEGAFDQFAANCRTASPCDQLNDPRQAVLDVTDRARQQPLPTSSSGRQLTYGLAFTGVLQALYSKALWPRLATALISAEAGDGSELLALADLYNERSPDGSYTNVLDANTTIGCNDSKPGPTDRTVRVTAKQWLTKFPLFGRWAASSLFGCQAWQPHRTIVPKPAAPTPTKVLVIGNLHDPATPYQGAEDLTKDLGNAELLSWDGQGHTSYLQGSACIDAHVNDYLLTQRLPADGTVCPKS